jgi:hypothetical protein
MPRGRPKKYKTEKERKKALKESVKKYQLSEKGKLAAKKHKQSEKGKESNKRGIKKYRETVKGKIAEKKYRESEKGKDANKRGIKKYRNSEKGKISIKKSRKKLLQTIEGRMANIMRKSISSSLKKHNLKKNKPLHHLIGCDLKKLKSHLEQQFSEEMNWENYGEWQVDHIVPINYFAKNYDFSNIETQQICFNYLNLQPLAKSINLSKQDYVSKEFAEKKISEIKVSIKK